MEESRRVLGDDHEHTLTAIGNMGYLLESMGKLEEAQALLTEVVDRSRRSLREGHWHTGVFLTSHGKCLAELNRHADAEIALLEAHIVLEGALGAEHKRTIKAIQSLADLYEAWHAAEPDQGYDAKAAEWWAKLESTDPPRR